MKAKLTNSTARKAAAGSIATLLAASSADAIVVYYDNTNSFTVDDINTFQGWDIDGDTVNEASIQSWFGNVIDIYGGGNAFQVVGASSTLQGMSSGVVISSAQSFTSSIYSIAGTAGPRNATGFSDGAPAYIGFSFDPDGAGAGPTLYGWAELVLSSGGSFGSVTVNRWAYEDSGAAIVTGVVPEPESASLGLGLLALGAAGVRRWRGAKRSA
ncbi:PEP-CTERM sorting domain-containing protein [Coraliomargarita akajimensis]|uniref:Ice-binding protein C-terminal domain-containing protein n=1 Tax=Coraliomargarita akajimensis (strain DSM 45221 / IAM 15411 / JCM 23193 / KCTC 12865 / 04OKA010-24) TaxID=583355 RepID=D5EIH5_CORAD|nr:PEP-CTERM sorting domain-containing protein [Coraliomargarita akajimensis]ADE54241.1 hypothetical protein Caka_1221 [Coraliomargarita akajimensis DSM 45221]